MNYELNNQVPENYKSRVMRPELTVAMTPACHGE